MCHEAFSRLAWEVARRARFRLDESRENDWRIRASVAVATGGEVSAWGRTHNEALRNLAVGLDGWAKEFGGALEFAEDAIDAVREVVLSEPCKES